MMPGHQIMHHNSFEVNTLFHLSHRQIFALAEMWDGVDVKCLVK